MPFNYFDEQNGSPYVVLSPYGSTAQRTALVPWNQINALYAYVFPVGTVPHSFPGLTGLMANSLTVEPYGGDQAKTANTTPVTKGTGDIDTHNTSEFARVTVTYETARVEQSIGSDPVVNLTHNISVGGQMLECDASGFIWVADSRTPSSDVSISTYIPTIEHAITWHNVPSPPFAAMRTCLGTVNSGAMTFNTGTIATETSLFTGAELTRDILSTGALAWRVTYRFSERRVTPAPDDVNAGGIGGWNHFYRSDKLPASNGEDADAQPKTGWYRLAVKTGRVNASAPVFPLVDHSTLFA